MKITYTILTAIALLSTQLLSHANKLMNFTGANGLISTTDESIAINAEIVSSSGGIATAKSPICTGTNAIIFLTGHNGSIQWQDSTEGIPFINIAAATNATYETTPLNTTRWFRAKVTQGADVAYSNKLEVAVKSHPVGSISGPANASQPCTDTALGYTLIINSSSLSPKFKLYKDGLPQTATGVINGNSYEIKGLKDAGIYTVKAHVPNLPECSSDMTGNFIIVPSITPNVFTVRGELKACEDSTSSADIALSGSEMGIDYTLSNSTQTKVGTGAALVFPIAAMATNNGTYIITATNTYTGCEGTMNGVAVIDILPSVGQPVITAEAAYCNMESNDLIAQVENATILTWSVSPTVAGNIENGRIFWNTTYSGPALLKLVVSNPSCPGGSKTTTFETEVMAMPMVSNILGDSLVCRNDVKTYTIIGERGVSYQWHISNATVTAEVDNIIGSIKVTYLEDVPLTGASLTVTPVSAVCGVGQPKTLIVMKDKECNLSGNTKVAEMEGSAIHIFPNPVTNQINVSMSADAITELSISDATGRVLFSKSVSSDQESSQVDVSELTEGVYIITAKSYKTVLVTKFYKQ